jgi:hypothetical protein
LQHRGVGRALIAAQRRRAGADCSTEASSSGVEWAQSTQARGRGVERRPQLQGLGDAACYTASYHRGVERRPQLQGLGDAACYTASYHRGVERRPQLQGLGDAACYTASYHRGVERRPQLQGLGDAACYTASYHRGVERRPQSQGAGEIRGGQSRADRSHTPGVRPPWYATRSRVGLGFRV